MHVIAGPRELVLVRHAESRGNVADRQAREAGAERLTLDARDADVPLSALGEQQAADLGAHLASRPAEQRPTAVLSSPYARALQTARFVVERAGLDLPVETDERLRERELGAFDGLTARGIRAHYPEEAARRQWLGTFYYRPPGGELGGRAAAGAAVPAHRVRAAWPAGSAGRPASSPANCWRRSLARCTRWAAARTRRVTGPPADRPARRQRCASTSNRT